MHIPGTPWTDDPPTTRGPNTFLSQLCGCNPCRQTRCRVRLMPGVPILLTRYDRLSAHQAPIFRGPVVRSAWRRLGLSVDAPPQSKLCHCQFCMTWVCLSRQPSVTVHHTAVQHRSHHHIQCRYRHHAQPCHNVVWHARRHMDSCLS